MLVSIRATLFLAALATTTALAQTSTTTAQRPVHHATTATAAANPADNAPGVPPVTDAPKPLYALRFVDTLVGTGPVAEPQKFYTVRYTGWLTDGTKFDSSDDHPGQEPITFPYGAHRVIPGWDTGFEGMHVGGKRRLYIPYQLAYGEAGRPPVIPAKSDLIFDIELVSISDTPPPDPNTPPAPSSADPASNNSAPAQSTPSPAGSPPLPNTAVPPATAPKPGTSPQPK